jgi:Mg-chelatase subunit ChlI
MDQAFGATLDRARLAAADLAAAANRVIALHTIKPEDVRDAVDTAVLSRRWTSYASSRTLDQARADLAFAAETRDEVEAISASATSSAAGQGGIASESAVMGRLLVLAAECERRAASLRG